MVCGHLTDVSRSYSQLGHPPRYTERNQVTEAHVSAQGRLASRKVGESCKHRPCVGLRKSILGSFHKGGPQTFGSPKTTKVAQFQQMPNLRDVFKDGYLKRLSEI